MKVKFIERPFELKSIEDNGTFTGYGSIFGEIDSYRDVVHKGAFAESLKDDFSAKNRLVPMLYQHSSRDPIGVYREVKEDDTGLFVRGEINLDVQRGKETHSLMKQGALSGLSIGYNPELEDWDTDNKVNNLRKVRLWEISPVTFPAGDSARVSLVKSIDNLITLSDFEDYLREAGGFSKGEARDYVSRFKANIARREAGDDGLLKKMQESVNRLNIN